MSKSDHRFCSSRCRHRGVPDPDAEEWPEELLEIQLGPGGGRFTVERLSVVWESVRDRLLSPDHPTLPGTRPWAFWVFDFPGGRPEGGQRAEALALADAGVLRDDELAALHEKANEARTRIGTDRERFSGGGRETGVPVDAHAVALWDAVAARQKGQV